MVLRGIIKKYMLSQYTDSAYFSYFAYFAFFFDYFAYFSHFAYYTRILLPNCVCVVHGNRRQEITTSIMLSPLPKRMNVFTMMMMIL